jgi:hypothetical protein
VKIIVISLLLTFKALALKIQRINAHGARHFIAGPLAIKA